MDADTADRAMQRRVEQSVDELDFPFGAWLLAMDMAVFDGSYCFEPD